MPFIFHFRVVTDAGFCVPGLVYTGASPPAFGWAMSDAVLLGSLHNYRLMFARMEARGRGEDIGDVAADKLSIQYHFVCHPFPWLSEARSSLKGPN